MTTARHLKRWLPLLILICGVVIIYASGLHHYLNFETIKAHRDALLNHVEQHFLITLFLYGFVYTLAVALSLPFATALTLLGGFLFGLGAGTLIVVTSATLGATIIFLIAKSSIGAFLREKAKGKYYERTAAAFRNNDLQYLLFLRLAPIFPFAVINILPALFNMDTRRYIAATFFGIMPGTAVYVYTGRSIGEIDNLSDLASPQVLSALFLLSLLALVPTAVKKFKGKKAYHAPQSED